MNLKERLKEAMISAMKAKQKERLETIRFIQAAIKKQEVDTRKDLDDAAVLAIFANLVKQRRDSIEQFKKGGREDLVAKEEAELALLKEFMPEQMSSEDLAKLVDAVVAETGASGMKDMGAVMKGVMAKAAGRAEGSAVSDMVKKRLSQA